MAVLPMVALTLVGSFVTYQWSAIESAIGASPTARTSAVAPGEVRFLKGQTHAHSNKSGDSQTPPADVARWYAEHGFDFVVFTDHNFVTSLPAYKETLLIPGVELTQNHETCEEPPPLPGMSCLLHVNALFVDPAKASTMPAAASRTRVALFGRALRATAAMGGLAQINHPNFQYSADAKVLAALVRDGALFVEIANEAFDSNNAGDATHPNTEALWDDVLTEGLTLYGVATDDAHHYYDAQRVQPAYVGNLGFVMVRARKDATAIRQAMARGDFYASTGLLFSRLEVRDGTIELQTEVEADFRCIGPKGEALSSARGRKARCEAPAGGYVRAFAQDAAGKKAWSQPVRRKRIAP